MFWKAFGDGLPIFFKEKLQNYFVRRGFSAQLIENYQKRTQGLPMKVVQVISHPLSHLRQFFRYVLYIFEKKKIPISTIGKYFYYFLFLSLIFL